MRERQTKGCSALIDELYGDLLFAANTSDSGKESEDNTLNKFIACYSLFADGISAELYALLEAMRRGHHMSQSITEDVTSFTGFISSWLWI